MKRVLLVLVGAVGLVTLGTAPAWAHVTVSGTGAVKGGLDAEISFRVPTESDTARTTGVTVALPTDTPIAGVTVEQIPGWTVSTTTTKLAKPISTDDGDVTEVVSRITWKAQPGQGIAPGAFGEFTILAGLLPEADEIVFKVVQTYSDNSTVNWIEVPAPGSSAEPEHPAPVLKLAAGASAAPSSAGPSSVPTVSAAPVVTTKRASTALPTTLSIVALALAAVALAFTVRRRRP